MAVDCVLAAVSVCDERKELTRTVSDLKSKQEASRCQDCLQLSNAC